MKTIYCINDTLINKNCNDFSKCYRGHILLEEDGWFEGYIKRVGYTYSEFIFGIYHPGMILDIYTCYRECPQVLHGKLDKNIFKGDFTYLDGKSSSDFEHKISFGKCKISEIELDSKISKTKSRLKDNCLEFYNKVYESRKELSDVLLRTYNGEAFDEKDKEIARDINNKKRC